MYIDTKRKIKQAVKLYRRMTVPEVAKEMHLSDRTIYHYLEIAKVKLRPQERDKKGKYLPA